MFKLSKNEDVCPFHFIAPCLLNSSRVSPNGSATHKVFTADQPEGVQPKRSHCVRSAFMAVKRLSLIGRNTDKHPA
jgi:hypothetical protein